MERVLYFAYHPKRMEWLKRVSPHREPNTERKKRTQHQPTHHVVNSA